MRVLALDPGKLVGEASARIDDEGEWWDLEHWIYGLKESALNVAYDQLRSNPKFYDVIVVEDWRLYRSHADEYVGSDMPYSQYIGMIRLIGWLSDTPVVMQGADRKQFALRQMRAIWPDQYEYVHRNMRRQHRDSHDMDAIIHLFAWTVANRQVRKHAIPD